MQKMKGNAKKKEKEAALKLTKAVIARPVEEAVLKQNAVALRKKVKV